MAQVTKGYLKINDTGKIERFQFNPSSLSESQNFNYSVISSPCCNYPKFVYTNTSEVSIPLELFLHGESQVSRWLSFLDAIKPSGRFNKPKTLTFAFGSTIKKVICTSVAKDFTEFNSSLKPTQCYIAMSLVEVR